MNGRENAFQFDFFLFLSIYVQIIINQIIIPSSSSSYQAVSGMREQRKYRYAVASSRENISKEVGKINSGYYASNDDYNRDNNYNTKDDDNANGEGELFGRVDVENI